MGEPEQRLYEYFYQKRRFYHLLEVVPRFMTHPVLYTSVLKSIVVSLRVFIRTRVILTIWNEGIVFLPNTFCWKHHTNVNFHNARETYMGTNIQVIPQTTRWQHPFLISCSVPFSNGVHASEQKKILIEKFSGIVFFPLK